jgi:hypothetical protein
MGYHRFFKPRASTAWMSALLGAEALAGGLASVAAATASTVVFIVKLL